MWWMAASLAGGPAALSFGSTSVKPVLAVASMAQSPLGETTVTVLDGALSCEEEVPERDGLVVVFTGGAKGAVTEDVKSARMRELPRWDAVATMVKMPNKQGKKGQISLSLTEKGVTTLHKLPFVLCSPYLPGPVGQ